MTITAPDAPVLTQVTSLTNMFYGCNSITTGNFNAWDVHTITDMSWMFYGCSLFNDNIGNWTTAAVTNMSYMFKGASAFNQPFSSNFNTAAVTDMSSMFSGASVFNQSLSNFNTTAVTNMSSMFYYASVFNQPLSSFSTANVTDMSAMFYYARAFNQPLSSFSTANVTSMAAMFSGAGAFNQPLSNFITTNVSNMNQMFFSASAFNQSLSSFNTAKVYDMSSMFFASAFNQPLINFNTAKVTNMSQMFTSARAFNQSLSNFITAAVTNMSNMFNGASAFNQPLSTFNTTKVTNMSSMFAYASAFNQSLSSFNTAAVTNMSGMFNSASAFNQPLSNFSTSAVTIMQNMFNSASAFNQNIGSWNIAQVADMSFMLDYSGMGIANYDATLIGWQASPHQSNVTLDATSRLYCASSTQRTSLINNSHWVINNDAYLYASTAPTLVTAVVALVTTSNVTCTDATGYQQFIDNLTSPTKKYMAINPNANNGYNFSVTAANNSPAINNQAKSDASQNTTALANRMYTVVDAGTNNYPSGMTVRIYYTPADTTAAVAALSSSVTSPSTSQWFKISGSTHAANVATILANQTSKTIAGATFLMPSAKGVEGGINYVEFAGITSFSTFGYLAAKTTSTLLPVTLASFKGVANGCMANLSWQSATESNSSYYGLEESSDGSTFNQVAKLNSGNSASGAAYTHAYPLQGGTNYFRLKMVDFDGRFSYSPTVAIVGTGNCDSGLKTSVSPNPTSDVLNIAGLSVGSRVTLYDMNGKKINTVLATATTATINMHAFAKGIYLLHIQKVNGTVETLKIVQQ